MIKFGNKVFYALAFLGCFNFLFAQQATIISSRPTIHQVNFDFVRNCCIQAQELRTDLLYIIHDLYDDIDYWKMQKLTNLSYFISKGPTGWFTEKSQQQELNEKIAFLKQSLELNAYYLGNIQYFLGKNYKEKPAEEIEENMRELLMLIQQCVSRETSLSSQANLNAEMQWAELLVSNKRNLITFKKRMQTAYYGYKKANHFRRNWLPYSIAAISALAVATYAYNNQEQIKQWHSNASTAFNNYCQTHIVDPIFNSIETLTDKSDSIEKQPIDDRTVEIERQARNEAIKIYRERQNNDTQKNWFQKSLIWTSDILFNRSKITEKKTAIEIQKEIEEANNGHIPDIIRDRNILLQTPIQNIVNGEFIREQLIEMQHVKTQVTEMAKNGIDTHNLIVKTLRSYKLIIELLTLFPTYILGKIIYNTSKSSLNYFNQKNNTPLKKNIRLIHRTLNKYTKASEISFTDQGFLVFWIHELKKRIQDVNLDDRYSFIEDLNDLLEQNFTVDQKKATIQQMYGTYNLLTPN